MVEPPLQYTNVKYMTHVKNVESYSRLVDICTGYGGKYNPGHQTLQVESLLNALNGARQALDEVKLAKTQFDREVNSRKLAYEKLPALATGILRTLVDHGATAETMEDARYFVRQIRGYQRNNRAPLPSAEGESAKVRRSVLQQSYVGRADYFSKLVLAVQAEPLYKAKEVMLNKAGLTQKVEELASLNAKVSTAQVAWSNARVVRDRMLYGEKSSLFTIQRAVKNYAYVVFGPGSEEFAQLKAIKFTKE
jgi:hypothetical protein